MQLKIYPLLNGDSKKAMRREKKRFGKYYNYTPRANLVKRLSDQLNISEEEVRAQIVLERNFIINNQRYF